MIHGIVESYSPAISPLILSRCWLLAVHAILPYTPLRLVKPFEFRAMDVITGLVAESAEGRALKHFR